MKTLNINRTVYDLSSEAPIIRECLIQLGFSPLANDLMFGVVARKVTLKHALNKHNVAIDTLNDMLSAHDIKVEDIENE